MSVTDGTFRVLRLIDVDKQFDLNMRSAVEPMILNKFDLSDPNYTEELSKMIFSDGVGADFVAKCQCGETEGNNKIGMICPICQTPVAANQLLDDDNLICRNWLSCPKELPGGWIAPKIYLNLANWLSYDKNNKKNYLDDILDVTVDLPHDLVAIIDVDGKGTGKGRGFDYLYHHFDRIMEFFINDHPVISKKPDTLSMKWCLWHNREKIFCHYAPILNSAINPIVSQDSAGSNKKRYSDQTADHAMKAAISLSRLEFSPPKRNPQFYVEKTVFKAYKDIIAYMEEATRKYVSTKKAIPRTHIFGSRFHWSFRGVVVPIIGPHWFYELHVPWKMAVNTLRVHILGKLCGDDYKLNIHQAKAKHLRALQIVDPDIKRIMDQMIEDSPYPGIPCVWDRPPSIRDGSVMLKYWTKIKPDVEDSCVGVTPTDAPLPNLDFDGDNLAGIIIPETEMVDAMRNLSPSALIYNRNTGEVTNEIGVNKTLCLTINRFLETV